MLVGRSAFDISGALEALNTALYNSLYAQAAISDALYDAVGRALGVPAHVLLGGQCRRSVRVGAVLTMKPRVEELIESAESVYERAFRHFGVKIGNDPIADVRNVRALREHFGDKVVLRVDANGAPRLRRALMLLKKLEPFDHRRGRAAGRGSGTWPAWPPSAGRSRSR